MVRHINFYECDYCEEQYDNMSQAQMCEFDHEIEKEQGNE